MQINGAQLAAAFSPKTIEFQQQTRVPVIIDVKPTVEFDEKTSRQTSSDRSLNQQAITTVEAQQARFVRLLANTEQPSSNNDSADQSEPLPRSVQQYLQVADLTSEQSKSLVDEIV